MRRFDKEATTGKGAIAEALGKNPKKRDFVIDAGEERVTDVEVGKERKPAFVPDFGGGLSTVPTDGRKGRFLRKAEITFESAPGGGCCSIQEATCGAMVLRRVSNCGSVRSNRQDAMSAMVLLTPLMKIWRVTCPRSRWSRAASRRRYADGPRRLLEPL